MGRLLWAHAARYLAVRKLYKLRHAGPVVGLMDGRKINFTQEEIANAKRRWDDAMRVIRGSALDA